MRIGILSRGQASFSTRRLVEACRARPLQARFAWVSDVQMRQREVKLYGKRLSRALDRVINSFQRDPEQEEYDWAVYLSTIAAIDGAKSSDESTLFSSTRPIASRSMKPGAQTISGSRTPPS